MFAYSRNIFFFFSPSAISCSNEIIVSIVMVEEKIFFVVFSFLTLKSLICESNFQNLSVRLKPVGGVADNHGLQSPTQFRSALI